MHIRINDQKDPDFQEELLLVQLEIQEHGIEMIRKEIYENVGQVLSLVKLYLSDHFPAKKPQLVKVIAHSKELVGKAITDLRQAARPVSIDEIREKGIMVAIHHELETLTRIHQTSNSFTVNGTFFRFDLTKELFAFRIIQEIISICNASETARHFTLQASYQETEVSFLVLCGQETAAADPDQFFANARKMQQRAGLIDAILSFSGQAGSQLAVLLRLPMNP